MKVNLTRRLERLEERDHAARRNTISVRILLVHPQDGLTGALLLESRKPPTVDQTTPEDEESVRESLERHRMGSSDSDR